mgnify:FL=1
MNLHIYLTYIFAGVPTLYEELVHHTVILYLVNYGRRSLIIIQIKIFKLGLVDIGRRA